MAARTLAVAALVSVAAAQTVPINSVTVDTRACLPPFDSLPFCDTGLSIDERVDDLVTRLWAGGNDAVIPFLLTARNYNKSALPALGLPEYDWGLNCIHGVQSSCLLLADGVTVACPTSFMNPVNYGAAWNASLIRALGEVIAWETRALWVGGAVEEGPRNHIGLDTWSPNINIARDPRWGRSCEVASEDPLLNGDFGAQYSLGLQYPAGGDPARLAAISTLKHWDAYSLEDSDGFTRDNFNAVVSNFALADTYFPAFEKSVKEGGALGVMCSYNAVNGVPTCASPSLTKVLRDTYGFEGYVTSDSGALEDIYDQHHFTNSSLSTVAPALRDGQCDVCSGSVYADSLLPALAAGLVAREDVDLALRHTLGLRFRLGLFDPPSDTPYWSVPPSAIGAPAAAALNLLSTQESLVLLKNDGATLPFPVGKRIAVIGPHGNATQALVGNYLGQLCPSNKFECIVSPFAALTAMNVGGSVTLTPGLKSVTSNDTSGFAAAVAAAAAADYVVLALGIDGSVEGEGHDRTTIDLPGAQHALAAAVAAAGKPTAVVLLHGGSVDVSAELGSPAIGAVLDAFYPGFLGGTVIAMTLLGANDHLGGKLPVTVYPASYVNDIPMSEMELDTGVGRGYRYYTGTPVLPFGFGLAYTQFSFAPVNEGAFAVPTTLRTGAAAAAAAAVAAYTINVTNVGAATGDTVVQQYFSPSRAVAARASSRLIRQLVGYQRVHLAPGESALVTLGVSAEALALRHRATGDKVSVPGEYAVIFEDGAGARLDARVVLEGEEVLLERFAMRS